MDQFNRPAGNVHQGNAACRDGQAYRRPDVWEKIPDTPEARKKMKGWVYELAEDSDYNGGSPAHKDPFYFIEVRLPGRIAWAEQAGK